MKILIIHADSTVDYRKFNNAIIEFSKCKSIHGIPYKSWPKFILIDEKKCLIHSNNELLDLMDHIGWIGNVLVVTSKQFMEHAKLTVQKQEYPNALTVVAQHVKDMFARPLREPCKHCNKEHVDYPCDDQIKHIRSQINRPLPEHKKICSGCLRPMDLCICNEHEKECIDCP